MNDIPSILIVEDELVVAMYLHLSIEQLGFRVAGECTTGEDALALEERVRPDVIIMDVHIKGKMDGIDTAAMIHKQRQVPIIFVTAYSGAATVDRLQHIKGAESIFKPIDDDHFKRVVAACCSRLVHPPPHV
jgi:CheY-like chemotaxis protein